MLLESRQQYRACHIQIPGEDQPMAAIAVDGVFYSLLRVMPDQAQANKICDRLSSKAMKTIVTRIPKGYAVWVHEPDALPTKPWAEPPAFQVKPPHNGLPPEVRLLQDAAAYEVCHILVPDLKMKLVAIWTDQKYFGLFKMVEHHSKAMDLAQRLMRGGDEVRVSLIEQGYAVWVLEPEAKRFVEA
jgi:hypothetical protein